MINTTLFKAFCTASAVYLVLLDGVNRELEFTEPDEDGEIQSNNVDEYPLVFVDQPIQINDGEATVQWMHGVNETHHSCKLGFVMRSERPICVSDLEKQEAIHG